MADKLTDAIERGRAFLDAGASVVFVPGKLDRESTQRLVEGLGRGKLSVIGVPGALSAREYQELGVARITYGPWTQRYALTALEELATSLYGGGVVPASTKPLN
jgi:2-methylisocitrate lyase-like PEP mutase family enzyme